MVIRKYSSAAVAFIVAANLPSYARADSVAVFPDNVWSADQSLDPIDDSSNNDLVFHNSDISIRMTCYENKISTRIRLKSIYQKEGFASIVFRMDDKKPGSRLFVTVPAPGGNDLVDVDAAVFNMLHDAEDKMVMRVSGYTFQLPVEGARSATEKIASNCANHHLRS